MIIEENIFLKDYTSYKTGGSAKYFAMCCNNDDIMQALDFANSNKLDYEVIVTVTFFPFIIFYILLYYL